MTYENKGGKKIGVSRQETADRTYALKKQTMEEERIHVFLAQSTKQIGCLSR